MQTGRRGFLGGVGATLIASRPVQADVVDSVVRAANASVHIAPAAYDPTEVWAYDGSIPGPGLRVKQGTRIRRRFENRLDVPSSIHWHGIRIENRMDGVAGLTQAPVPPGGDFDYDFVVPDAGTYWYHPHASTLEQLGRGLSAPLIVEEADGGPDIDADEVLVINDWRLDQDARILDDFGNLRDASHAGRIGNYVTVNGSGEYTFGVARGDRLRLRLINACTGRILTVGAQGLDGWVVALDGMPLDSPEPLDRIVLAPAQRADLLVDVTAAAGEDAFLISFERSGGYALAVMPVAAGTRAARPDPAPPLSPNDILPLGDLADALLAPMRITGGAMGGMAAAEVPGEGRLSPRALADRGLVWALNDVAGMPEQPLARVARGAKVRIPLANETSWPHGMHLHGHHFREVLPTGYGPWRDTIMLQPQSMTEIAFVADNPGKWMFHCHMLAHQASGMMTWIEVTA